MKRVLILGILAVISSAKIQTVPVSPAEVEKFNQIIDVRTPQEWKETGIIKGAKTVTLINDKELFLKKIQAEVDVTKPFAIICRSGHRSLQAAKLIDSPDFDITNLDGGMSSLVSQGYITVPYK